MSNTPPNLEHARAERRRSRLNTDLQQIFHPNLSLYNDIAMYIFIRHISYFGEYNAQSN